MYTNKQETVKFPFEADCDCLAVTVQMCKTCSLYLGAFGNENLISSGSEKWDEYKFVSSKNRSSLKEFTLQSFGGYPNGFWAIGNVRNCSKIETRALEVDGNNGSCVETNWKSFAVNFESQISPGKLLKYKA